MGRSGEAGRIQVINIGDYRTARQGYNANGNESSKESSKESTEAPGVESSRATVATDLKRMYWHSRRGMLELDLLLVPFATDCLATLEVAQIDDYRALLLEEDQDLWTWLTRREPAPTEALRSSIDLILQHNASAGAR